MKVICERTALLDAVNIVTGVVATRTPAPVLQCVKLTASDGLLMLAATDMEVGLRLGVEQVDVQEDGESLIPADKLAQIVRSSDDATPNNNVGDSKTTPTRLIQYHLGTVK